jgi:broad specificity phosphatase PhoE
MDTKFILIRHGESQANALKTYAGHSDFDLSELGRAQARVSAEFFKDEDISAIYASDLKRAFNTALAHAELHSMEVIPTKEFREINVGAWEATPIAEIRAKWPKEFDIDWKTTFGDMTPPGGEPVYEAGKRMYNKLLAIAKERDGKILVAAHAAVIRAFWCYMQGVEPSKWAAFVPFATNASATFVGFDGERLYPIKYSFDDYLADFNEKYKEA